MTQENNNYVVVKLVSGETVLALFEGEDERFIKVSFPINIHTMPIPHLNREQVHASQYCQFSDSTSFVLEKNHIIYIKRMHPAFISHYNNFKKSYDDALVPENALHRLDEFPDEELTVEEIKRRVDMLTELAGMEPEEEQEETVKTFVRGNDTIH